MRSLLLLLVSAIFISGSSAYAWDFPYEDPEIVPEEWSIHMNSLQAPVQISYQNPKVGDIFERTVWLDIDASKINSWERLERNILIMQCVSDSNQGNTEKIKKQCIKKISDKIQNTASAIQSKNNMTLRRSISRGDFDWLHEAVLSGGNYNQSNQIVAIKKYQDGFLFISKENHDMAIWFHFGFIRYNQSAKYLKIFMAPIAPQGSSQEQAYNTLYYVDSNPYGSDWFDTNQFQKDLKKSFNKNRFNNKGTQEVYSQFLKFVDENTPTR